MQNSLPGRELRCRRRMDDVPLPNFRLSLLGRFELIGSGGPVHLSNKKLAGLLRACTAPRPQPREKLATLLCGVRLLLHGPL
jgi:hypothetical protein